MARFWCPGFVAQPVGGTFSWGTMVVNVGESFIIGFFSALIGADSRFLVASDARTFVMVGFSGGYTTFFSLKSLGLGHVAADGLNQLQGA
jgi:CrcB protein